jgi:hypothetical protein
LLASALLVVTSVQLSVADDAKRPDSKPAARPAPARASLPNEKDCREWAARFEKAVKSGDLATCNELIDWDALLEKTTACPNLSPEQAKKRDEFIRAIKSKSVSRSGFAGQISETVRQGGSHKFLRLRIVDGRRRAQFRYLSRVGDVTYHEFILTSSKRGLVRADDFYVFAPGELQSENLRPWFLPFVLGDLPGGREQLTPAEREIATHASEIAAIRDAIRANKPRHALEIYERLPQSLMRMKAVLNGRLVAAAMISEADYLRAFDDFRKYYPDEPGLDLTASNAFLIRKAYDQALACVARADKALGGDPYLKVTRAIILLEQGKADASWKMAERALAEDPTLLPAYNFLISHSIQTRNFAKTAELLTTVESKFHWKVPDLAADPAFAEFVKSESYKAWMKSRPAEK